MTLAHILGVNTIVPNTHNRLVSIKGYNTDTGFSQSIKPYLRSYVENVLF